MSGKRWVWTIPVAYLVLARGLMFADPVPTPRFAHGGPVAKEIVVEESYQFRMYEFKPPATFEPIKKELASYASPEEALTSHLSSIIAGDADWFVRGWMAGERESQRLELPIRTTAWKQFTLGRRYVVHARGETLGYVFFDIELQAGPGGPAPQEEALRWDLLVLGRENGEWLATQALRRDPVLAGWLAKTPIRYMRRQWDE